MSALLLKLIACAAMLVDHIGYLWGISAFRAVGRIAFPIFLFLIYNGYRHTSNRVYYALRLGLFAFISQVPFSLFTNSGLWGRNGNVFFALFFALLCIWAADSLSRRPVGRYFCMVPAFVVYAAFVFGYLRADNGVRAIVLSMVFWLFDGKAWWKRLIVAGGTVFAVCNSFFIKLAKGLLFWAINGSLVLPTMGRWEMMQLFSLLALPLIFAYNGQKGRMPAGKLAARAAQLGFYLFYPVHLLILWFIRWAAWLI